MQNGLQASCSCSCSWLVFTLLVCCSVLLLQPGLSIQGIHGNASMYNKNINNRNFTLQMYEIRFCFYWYSRLAINNAKIVISIYTLHQHTIKKLAKYNYQPFHLCYAAKSMKHYLIPSGGTAIGTIFLTGLILFKYAKILFTSLSESFV